MKIAYISDLHLDFYVNPWAAWQRKLQYFLAQLLPDEPADVLIVAGDLSHYDAQSMFALTFFAKHFQQVFYVMGNHDYYLLSNKQRARYKRHSINREIALHAMTSTLSNVTLLQHYNVVAFEDVLFAGSTNWYGLHTAKERAFFAGYSNDSVLIKQLSIREQHMQEMAAYAQLPTVDVLVTHVPSLHITSHVLHGSTDCYLNQLPTVKAAHHIFGHCHEQHIYSEQHATYYINALGYPDKQLPKKIRVFTL